MSNRRKKNPNPDLPVFIYALDDPRVPGEIRYIGSTQSPRARLTQHILQSDKIHPVYEWIRGLLVVGVEPRLRILWSGPAREAIDKEDLAIRRYRELGFPLVNQRTSESMSPESIQRMLRVRWTPEKRKVYGARHAGRPLSAAHRRALSQSHIKRHAS